MIENTPTTNQLNLPQIGGINLSKKVNKKEKIHFVSNKILMNPPPDNYKFKILGTQELNTRIMLMKSYIEDLDFYNTDQNLISLGQKNKIDAAWKVLDSMLEQIKDQNEMKLNANNDNDFIFKEITIKKETLGLCCIKKNKLRLYICSLLTAPWNIVPPSQIESLASKYHFTPHWGIGSIILQNIIEFARNEKFTKIELVSLNENSKQFYLKHQFKELEDGEMKFDIEGSNLSKKINKKEKIHFVSNIIFKNSPPEKYKFKELGLYELNTRIELMKSYIEDLDSYNTDQNLISSEQKNIIDDAWKILDTMLEQIQNQKELKLNAKNDSEIIFREIIAKKETLGLFSIQKNKHRLYICSLLTAPWNIVPPNQIESLGSKYHFTPHWGIGSIILQDIIEFARNEKFTKIELVSWTENSKQFFLKHQFKELEPKEEGEMALDL